jgi:putative oxidoreductase
MQLISSETILKLIRYSLALVFLWFGILKLFNASAVYTLVQKSMLMMPINFDTFFLVLAVLEMAIGLGMIWSKTAKLAALIMIGHLTVATVSTLITQGFLPRFPILSLEGEFVLKNLVLILVGVLIIITPQKSTKEESVPAS